MGISFSESQKIKKTDDYFVDNWLMKFFFWFLYYLSEFLCI